MAAQPSPLPFLKPASHAGTASPAGPPPGRPPTPPSLRRYRQVLRTCLDIISRDPAPPAGPPSHPQPTSHLTPARVGRQTPCITARSQLTAVLATALTSTAALHGGTALGRARLAVFPSLSVRRSAALLPGLAACSVETELSVVSVSLVRSCSNGGVAAVAVAGAAAAAAGAAVGPVNSHKTDGRQAQKTNGQIGYRDVDPAPVRL